VIRVNSKPRRGCGKKDGAPDVICPTQWSALSRGQQVKEVANYLGVDFIVSQPLRLLDLDIDPILVRSFRSEYDIWYHSADDVNHERRTRIEAIVVFNQMKFPIAD